MINHLKLKTKLMLDGYIFSAFFLDGLKVPDESVIKYEYLEEKSWRKKINFRLKDWEYLVNDIGVALYQSCMMKITTQKKYGFYASVRLKN